MYKFAKRFFDVLLSLFGLLLLVPFSIVIKISFLILGDKGKITYSQIRVGKDGKPFRIYKFRSMALDANRQLEELLKDEKYEREWKENQKLENDPRITHIGRLLRKSSLDEMPQLLNVLKGEMSLVGPRPLVPGELESHNGSKLYWEVKPGITGWWASHGRSNLNYDERLELEYYYIRNQSLKLDFICIMRTIMAVLTHNGAK